MARPAAAARRADPEPRFLYKDAVDLRRGAAGRGLRQDDHVRQADGAAAAAGGIQGSGVAGGLASLSSQFGANLGFGAQMGALSGQITTLSGLQSTQQAQSGMYGNIANLGFGLAGAGIKFGSKAGDFVDTRIMSDTYV